MARKPSAYAAAGVDIDVMMDALRAAKRNIQKTATADVVRDVGSFGGLHRSPGSRTVLVSSIDGVGTKLKVAHQAGIHHTVGQDLVNHCTNDILAQGAKPLFFLDYIGASKLDPTVFADVVKGLCIACRRNGCALLGGETAEMPGLYPDGEYDLVGTIVGAVERRRLITGDTVRPGDVLIGLKSSGLHTNGYSLARRIVFEQAGLAIDDRFPGTKRRVHEVLLRVHRSYLKSVSALFESVPVRGLAHITGGGLIDNVPRALPEGVAVEIDTDRWRIPPVFRFLADAGAVDFEEMYRVFNMGIGMVVIVRAKDSDRALATLRDAGERPALIGKTLDGAGRARLC